MGFGTALCGVVASLTPHIPPAERADVLAVLYVLAYLSFSVPTVIAGILVGIIGLGATTTAYGAVAIALATAALVQRARR